MIQVHRTDDGAAIYKRWLMENGTPRHKWVSVSHHEIPRLIAELRAVYDKTGKVGAECPTA